jgi:hypothetical protein
VIIFLAVISAMSIILPIVIGILLANIYAEDLLEQSVAFQFIVLGGILFVLITINVFVLYRTMKFKKRR